MIDLLVAAALLGSAPSAADMNGLWSVDLSVTASEPYLKPMTLTLGNDGVVVGDFYESKIEAGRWKLQNGRLCVSFRTSDGVGPYHSSACLVGDSVEGHTWAEQRAFVFIWTARRPTSN